jgi:hypothetical protein
MEREPFVDLRLFLCLIAVTAACSGRGDDRGPRDGGTSFSDAGPRRDGDAPFDSGLGPVNPCAPGCGPTELCGEMGDGNGLDDDCNGDVDETCTCPATGITRPCFAGPPDRRSVGSCADGIETCDEFLQWSPCTGGVAPAGEVCDGADNDCNGVSDDIAGCSSDIHCPATGSASPLSTYELRGATVYSGAATGWQWSIDCPDSVPAALCPSPADATAQDTSVYFTASGAYRVSVNVVKEDGTTGGCSWTVYVQGTGLRVELNWDTMLDTAGGTDVDLHLHRWTQNGVDTDWFGAEDCFYGNCTPDVFFAEIDWPDHAPSDLSNCADAPHGGGAAWTAAGSCRNPRLDVDTNGTDGPCSASVTDPNLDAFCAPENINVDSPIVGMPYRVMVNYSNDSGHPGPTNVAINIYCGGALRAHFGTDPLVYLRNGQGAGAVNDNWHVADVVFFRGMCGMDCMVYPVDQVVPADDVRFTLPFGPAWSCAYDPAAETCTP